MDDQGDWWRLADTAVGGHVDWGETIDVALAREAREEIGINAGGAKRLLVYDFTSAVEHELVNVFVTTADDDFQPRAEKGEIDELRFWSFNEIEDAMGKGVLTPNFEQEFQRIKMALIVC